MGLCVGKCFSEFIDWRYSQSCWYFWPSFVNCCPYNLLTVQLPSPLSCVNKYTVYTNTVCVGGGGVSTGFWLSDRWTSAAKSLYRLIFLDDNILHCLLWILSFYACNGLPGGGGGGQVFKRRTRQDSSVGAHLPTPRYRLIDSCFPIVEAICSSN
jgi:hypothetical protein